MIQFVIKTLLILVLSYFSCLFFPWWSVVIVGGMIGLTFSQKRRRKRFERNRKMSFNFLAGFLAIFLLWGGMAYLIDQENHSILSQKILQLLSPDQEHLNSIWLILLSGAVGGILGGLGSMTGNYLGEALKS